MPDSVKDVAVPPLDFSQEGKEPATFTMDEYGGVPPVIVQVNE